MGSFKTVKCHKDPIPAYSPAFCWLLTSYSFPGGFLRGGPPGP